MQRCHALIPVQSLLLRTDCGEARMSRINFCAVSSPSYGIMGRQGGHLLIPVQSLLLRTGLWARMSCIN